MHDKCMGHIHTFCFFLLTPGPRLDVMKPVLLREGRYCHLVDVKPENVRYTT